MVVNFFYKFIKSCLILAYKIFLSFIYMFIPLFVGMMVYSPGTVVFWLIPTFESLWTIITVVFLTIPTMFASYLITISNVIVSSLIFIIIKYIFVFIAFIVYLIFYKNLLNMIIKLMPIVMLLCLTIIKIIFILFFLDIIDIQELGLNSNDYIIILKKCINNFLELIFFGIYLFIQILIFFFYKLKIIDKDLLDFINYFGKIYFEVNYLNYIFFFYSDLTTINLNLIYIKFNAFIDLLSYCVFSALDYIMYPVLILFEFMADVSNEDIYIFLKFFLFVIWFIYASIKFFFFFLIYPILSLVLLLIDFADGDNSEELDSFPDTTFFFAEYTVGFRDQYYPDSHNSFYIFSEKIQSDSLNFIKHVSFMYFDLGKGISKYMFPQNLYFDEPEPILIEIAKFELIFIDYLNHLIVFEQTSILDFLEINHPTLSTSIKSILKSDSFIGLFTDNISIITFYSYILMYHLFQSINILSYWMDYQMKDRTNDLGILDIVIDIKNYIKNIIYKHFFAVILWTLLILFLLFFIGIIILYILA